MARTVLAAAAVLMLAWVGVLLRDQSYIHQAVPLINEPNISPERFNESMRRLEDAELLNPDSSLDLARAKYYLLHGRRAQAARTAAQLVRDEPENIDGWRVLLFATDGVDRPEAARAEQALRRLNPLAKL